MRGPVVLVFLLRGVADEPGVAHVIGGADAGSAEEFVGDEDGEEEEGLFFRGRGISVSGCSLWGGGFSGGWEGVVGEVERRM